MSADTKDVDLVIYGAGGYTGILVCRYLLHEALPKRRLSSNHNNSHPLKWVVCGRRKEPLEALLKVLRGQYDDVHAASTDSASATTYVASAMNVSPDVFLPTIEVCTVEKLATAPLLRRAKVLINCAGPFAITGLDVLGACIKNRVHYTDVNGEPLFLRKAHRLFHDDAKANKVTAIVCSGFDCVPAEVAVTTVVDGAAVEISAARSSSRKGVPVHELFVNTYLKTNDGLSSGTMHTLLNSLTETKPRDKTKKKKAKRGGGVEEKNKWRS